MSKRGWLAMVAGSAILLVLIAAFGITTAHEADRIYSEVSSTNGMIQLLNLELSGLRSDMYLSGIYVRDQLLDSRSEQAEDQRDSLRDVHDAMEQRLTKIASLVPEEQASTIAELRNEITGYWESVAPVMEDPVAATTSGYAALRRQMLLRRDSALAIAEQIGKLNEETFLERHERVDSAQRTFLVYIRTMMAFSLAIGAFVFIGSGYTVNVLNRRAEAHRKQTEQAERELRRLSSKLLHAQEQERRSISRELHDEVGQTLTALGIELGNLEQLRNGRQDQFRQRLEEAKKLTQDTMRTVRQLAMGLRPAMLDDSGLAPAVRYQAREFSRRSGIPVTVDIEGTLEHLPEAHRTCVYRVVQEALTNCARHAKAANIRIMLHGGDKRVSLAVQDDGIGLRQASSSGMGLIGIEERARELGGTVHIDSRLNRGTLLQVDLPIVAGT
jgi:signal transduction histidine kinase